MNTNRSTSFFTAAVFTAAAAAALLTGCGSGGIGDVFGNGRSSDRYGRYSGAGDVRGTVERVDTRDRYIVVDREDDDYAYRGDLRHRDDDRYDDRYGGDEVVLYYDDATKVEHQGRDYRPEDLEPGDRIAAEVQRTGDRLIVEDIDVLYDAGASRAGGIGDDRYDRNDDLGAADVRGTVRYIDTRDRTLEIEPTRWGNDFSTGRSYGDRVTVRYDDQTRVEFQGQRYGPENIERGDVVEIEVRNLGQERLLAEEIRVVRDTRSVLR